MILTPYFEKIVSDHLRDHADVSALGARVVGKTPKSVTDPWVRVTQLDAGQTANDRADHLVEGYLQLDCYAGADGGQPEANLLVRTVRGALQELPGIYDEAVVSSCRINGAARIPDTDFEPARERFVLTASVHAHAV